MDPVSAAASSIQAINNVLQAANLATIEAAEKIMQVTVETALSQELGKGQALDLIA